MEHDSKVIEYYDQPPPFKLNYKSINGRNLGHMHTPDFFLLHNDYSGWIECKTEENLLELSVKQPNRFQLDESGVWVCPPGKEHASKFGLEYCDGLIKRHTKISYNQRYGKKKIR